jgi:pyruvate-formate lyase
MSDTLTAAEQRKLDLACNFTRAYRANLAKHPAIREAACLREQYPALCDPLRDYDLFAGRVLYHPFVAFLNEGIVNTSIPALRDDDRPDTEVSPHDAYLRSILQREIGGYVYNYQALHEIAGKLPETDPRRKDALEICAFWEKHSPMTKYMLGLGEEFVKGMSRVNNVGPAQYATHFFRLCCFSIDFDKLLRLGIPGLRAEIQKGTAGEPEFRKGALMALDTLVDVCRFYASQARGQAAAATTEKRKTELNKMVIALENITGKKPENLREAIQLFWLYNILSDSINYGRTDVYLGDFFVNDIARDTLSRDEAKDLLRGLWRLISDQFKDGFRVAINNCRIIIGGKGRRNPGNADQFAMAAMEVTLETKEQEPNVTLRFYKGQNPALFDKALELIAAGCVSPTLYNDDEHIPMCAKAYNVSMKEAENYIPQGCGEIQIDHKSITSPNNIITFLSALDLVLHDGWNPKVREHRGLRTGPLSNFDTYEKLYAAVKKQIDYTNELFARRNKLEDKIHAETAGFLFTSILTDDCIARGKSIFAGGVRYRGSQIETFGLTNTADSLAVIKKLVYEEKKLTLEQVVKAIDANFEGYEKQRQMMRDCPKFGNDEPYVDAIYADLCKFVNENVAEKAKKCDLHFFLNCNLNPGGVRYGAGMNASPDGRKAGDALAVGNAPAAGADRNGLTALLNSMKRQYKLHCGFVQNLKVARSLLTGKNLEKFKAAIQTYFETGGIHLMITCLNRGDLEDAMIHPEKYPNLLVRVGGWTARFVNLEKAIQKEILERTLYE